MSESALERQLRASLKETASPNPSSERELLAGTNWPSPDDVELTSNGYRILVLPDSPVFARTTAITKLLGTGTDALIKWGAEVEHDACIEAACEVYADPNDYAVSEFESAIESKLGAARAHVRKLAKAGDIGSAIHDMIRWTLSSEIGGDPGPKPALSQEAGWGFMSWQVWWEKEKARGAKPIRVEQPVWNKGLRYAGTIDFVASYPDGLDLLDWKSSSGIYDSHHVQVTGYALAARELLGVEFRRRRIVRLPKVVGDLEVYEKEVGDLTYDYVNKKTGKRVAGGRMLTAAQLEAAFTACRTLYAHFVEDK